LSNRISISEYILTRVYLFVVRIFLVSDQRGHNSPPEKVLGKRTYPRRERTNRRQRRRVPPFRPPHISFRRPTGAPLGWEIIAGLGPAYRAHLSRYGVGHYHCDTCNRAIFFTGNTGTPEGDFQQHREGAQHHRLLRRPTYRWNCQDCGIEHVETTDPQEENRHRESRGHLRNAERRFRENSRRQ